MIRPLLRFAVRAALFPLKAVARLVRGESEPARPAPPPPASSKPPPKSAPRPGPSAFDVQVDPADVVTRRRAGNEMVFVDVRERGELMASGKIEGALHIPLRDVPSRHSEIPRDKEVVVYCAAGMRSLDAAMFLRDQGFDRALSLSGGIGGWSGAGGVLVPHS